MSDPATSIEPAPPPAAPSESAPPAVASTASEPASSGTPAAPATPAPASAATPAAPATPAPASTATPAATATPASAAAPAPASAAAPAPAPVASAAAPAPAPAAAPTPSAPVDDAAAAASTGEVTASSPVAARLLLWSKERFPLGPVLVFSGVTVLSAAAAVAAIGEASLLVDARLVLAWLGHVLTLLVLRLLDEHKDHEKDILAHPERALSRGIVTLPLLGQVAAVAAGLAVLQAWGLGLLSLWSYALVLVFAQLMSKEFFIGRALEKDVFVYALAHQPINPLITAWLLISLGRIPSIAALNQGMEGVLRDLLPLAVLPYLGAQAALGFGFEIARKVWTPAEEKPGLVQSYSSHGVGPQGAAWIALALLFSGCALMVDFVARTGLATGHPGVVAVVLGSALVCAAACAASVGRFARAPFPGASKKLQAAVGLGSLLLQGGLIAAVIARHGVLLQLTLGDAQ